MRSDDSLSQGFMFRNESISSKDTVDMNGLSNDNITHNMSEVAKVARVVYLTPG